MSWARATLRRGTSSGSVWQVDANYPQARVVVGSAPNAGWVVTGPGIALFHVELYWDGNALYVADTQAVGDVRLDGKPVRDWVQVQGRGQLLFGNAILEIETAVAEATAMVRDPGTAPRISLLGESTRVQSSDADSELDNERTRVAASLDEIPPSKAMISKRPPPPPGRAPAQSVPPPPPARSLAPTAPAMAAVPAPPQGGADRPRLGGAGGPPPPGRPEARTLVGGDLPPIGGEATRMVDTENLAPSAGAAPSFGAPQPPQGFGGQQQGFGGQPQGFAGQPQGFAGQPQGFAGQPQGFAGQPQGFAGQPQGFAGQPQGFAGQPQPGGFGSPQGAAGVQVDASLQPAPPPSAPSPMNAPMPIGGAGPAAGSTGAVPPATGGFVPPPSFNASQQVKPEDGSVPRRTRLLIMLFAAVVIAWLMMPTPEEEEAAERAAHPPPPTALVIPPGVDGGVDAGPRPYQNPSTFVPVLTSELLDGGLSRTPDSVAAQLVNDGHLEDALVQYEALRTAHPERPEYGVMCEVIRRQLMSRCTNGQLWNGTPCVSP